MHIPENYLSPETCAVMAAAMVPVWYKAVKKVKETVPKEKMPLLGIFAAFSFLSMMFNIPLPGGTTGHAVGGTLIALLLGPEAACRSPSPCYCRHCSLAMEASSPLAPTVSTWRSSCPSSAMPCTTP